MTVAQAQRQKSFRDKRLSSGMCADCGKEPPIPGITRCLVCKQRHAENEKNNPNRKKLREENRAKGRCVSCSNLAVPGMALCSWHRFQNTMRSWLYKCKAVELLGGGCVRCGQTDVRILEFDHKKNDGGKHRKTEGVGKGSILARWILSHPDEAKDRLQVLCACCHALKNYERSMM